MPVPHPQSPMPAARGPETMGHEPSITLVPAVPRSGEEILQVERDLIAATSPRNDHLMLLDESFNNFRRNEGKIKRIVAGKLNFPLAVAERSRDNRLREAKVDLRAACGSCALNCAIRGDFGKWARVHREAREGKELVPGQEARRSWRLRLIADPEASCLPPDYSRPSLDTEDD